MKNSNNGKITPFILFSVCKYSIHDLMQYFDLKCAEIRKNDSKNIRKYSTLRITNIKPRAKLN